MKVQTAVVAVLVVFWGFGLRIGNTASAENPMHVRQLLETKQCERCDLFEAKLNFANLRGANLRDAELYRADLKMTDLQEANLSGANLYKADLRGANLTNANLNGADLKEVNFCGATMPDGSKSQEGCKK